MATKPTAAIARIQAANSNAYDPTTNPGGLASGGHRQNFTPDLQAVVDVGVWVEGMAGDIEGLLDGADDSAVAAAASAGQALGYRNETSQLKADTLAMRDAANASADRAVAAADSVDAGAIDARLDVVEAKNALQDDRLASLEVANLTARQIALAIAYTGAR